MQVAGAPVRSPSVSQRTASRRRPAGVLVRAATQEERYAARGVSAAKEDVHAAIKNLDKGLFPKAFCKARTEMPSLEPTR